MILLAQLVWFLAFQAFPEGVKALAGQCVVSPGACGIADFGVAQSYTTVFAGRRLSPLSSGVAVGTIAKRGNRLEIAKASKGLKYYNLNTFR